MTHAVSAETIEAPETDYDPFALDSLHHVHEMDGRCRELAPVVYVKKYDYYAITRFAEIRKALRDPRTFSSTSRPFYAPSPFRPTILILEDPPEHTRSKGAVLRVLSDENLAKIEQYFVGYAEKLIDQLLACLLYTSPSPRDGLLSRMPSSA